MPVSVSVARAQLHYGLILIARPADVISSIVIIGPSSISVNQDPVIVLATRI